MKIINKITLHITITPQRKYVSGFFRLFLSVGPPFSCWFVLMVLFLTVCATSYSRVSYVIGVLLYMRKQHEVIVEKNVSKLVFVLRLLNVDPYFSTL